MRSLIWHSFGQECTWNQVQVQQDSSERTMFYLPRNVLTKRLPDSFSTMNQEGSVDHGNWVLSFSELKGRQSIQTNPDPLFLQYVLAPIQLWCLAPCPATHGMNRQAKLKGGQVIPLQIWFEAFTADWLGTISAGDINLLSTWISLSKQGIWLVMKPYVYSLWWRWSEANAIWRCIISISMASFFFSI